MNWFVSLLLAALAGGIGLVTAGVVASAYAYWYHVSTFEGEAGYFVVAIAILGGLAAFVIGLVTSRLVTPPGFWRALGYASGIVLGIAGVVGLTCYVLADIPPTIAGAELRLEVEIRLPAGHGAPAGTPTFTLGSVVNHVQRASQQGELKLNAARLEDARWVIPAEVFLFTGRGLRSIHAEVDGQTVAAFIVPVPAHPGTAHEQWSEWGPRPPAGSPPWPDSQPSYRFRVQRIVPPQEAGT